MANDANGSGHELVPVREEPAALSPHRYEPRTLGEAYKLAQLVVASGIAPSGVTRAETAMVILATGAELGLSAMQSLRSIYVVDGRPSLSADLMAALVMRSPVCRWFRCVESTGTSATYETLRVGYPEPRRLTMTMEQMAKVSRKGQPLISGSNWKNYPDAMLRARAKSALARDVYPDVVGGLYCPDELGTDEEIRPVEARVTSQIQAAPTWTETVPEPQVEAPAASVPAQEEPAQASAQAPKGDGDQEAAIERIKALLVESGCPQELWGETIEKASGKYHWTALDLRYRRLSAKQLAVLYGLLKRHLATVRQSATSADPTMAGGSSTPTTPTTPATSTIASRGSTTTPSSTMTEDDEERAAIQAESEMSMSEVHEVL